MKISYSNVSRETSERVIGFFSQNREVFSELIDLWTWWNRSVNIFSRRISAPELSQHILHSLYLSALPDGKKYQYVLDAGSGGGLPGIPLALVNPDKYFILLDKSEKKILVLRDILRRMNIGNAKAVHSLVTEFQYQKPLRIVTKHAFKLETLLNDSRHLNRKEISFLKGEDFKSELSPLLPSTLKEYNLKVCSLGSDNTRFFQGKYVVSFFPFLTQVNVR